MPRPYKLPIRAIEFASTPIHRHYRTRACYRDAGKAISDPHNPRPDV